MALRHEIEALVGSHCTCGKYTVCEPCRDAESFLDRYEQEMYVKPIFTDLSRGIVAWLEPDGVYEYEGRLL